MTIGRSFNFVKLVMVVMVTALSCTMARAAENLDPKPKRQNVTYKRMSLNDYQNFLRNWDEKKHALLYALIQTPAQYDALFAPATLMGNRRPFAPEAAVYTKEQILLVARVMAAPQDMEKSFAIERLSESNQQLEFHYRFNEPKPGASHFVKNYLGVRIPRHDYKKVIFFENGKKVGVLSLAHGQWSVPELTPKPNQADAGDDK